MPAARSAVRLGDPPLSFRPRSGDAGGASDPGFEVADLAGWACDFNADPHPSRAYVRHDQALGEDVPV